MSATRVNVDNFVRAESNRMFAGFVKDAGDTGAWHHNRQPTPLDKQTVIRMNRDTLYSFAVVDISKGATLTIPDAGDRYLSVMAINQDHYINKVFHEPGEHRLTVEEFDTPYVALGARTLADPNDPDDVAAANALQDQLKIDAGANQPFELPDYDKDSFDATRNAILTLGRGLTSAAGAFGARDEVDPVHHLIGSAGGWGGLPETEAHYINVDPGLEVREYKLTVKDVPVDAFWSISVYNKDGFFEPNERNMNSVNSVTAEKDADGSVTVHFGNSDADKPNYLPIMDGWNYTVRLYRPRPEILDGRWTFPELEKA